MFCATPWGRLDRSGLTGKNDNWVNGFLVAVREVWDV